MDEFKTTNRGGARNKGGRPVGTTHDNLNKTYKPSINVLKELEKLYKDINKKQPVKEELEIVKTKIDLLNKLLPYVEMKKPVSSLIDESAKKVPEMTVIKVKGQDDNNDDFV